MPGVLNDLMAKLPELDVNLMVWAVVLASLSGVVYALRSYVTSFFGRLWTAMTHHLEVHASEAMFRNVDRWLHGKRTWFVKDWKTTGLRHYDDEGDESILVPGFGTCFILNPFTIVTRACDDSHKSQSFRSETITLTVISFRREKIRKLFEDIQGTIVVRKKKARVFTMVPDGYNEYMYTDIGTPARISRLPSAAARDLAERMIARMESGKYFGVLLHGAPGTGKSKFAAYLAHRTNRSLYIVSPPSKAEKAIMKIDSAFLNVPERSIILMDDLDMWAAGGKRKNNVALHSLLNVLDGVTSFDNRVVIACTNNPDQLDPALLRKGRLGETVEFEPLTPEEQAAWHAERFGEEIDPRELSARTVAEVDAEIHPEVAVRDLLTALAGYLREDRSGELVFRCPLCGDSRNPTHGHLQIRLDPPPPVWHCHRCGSGGVLNRDLLLAFGMDPSSAGRVADQAAKLAGGARRRKPEGWRAVERRFPASGPMDGEKLRYLNGRGVSGGDREMRDLRVVWNFFEFAEENGMRPPEVPAGFDAAAYVGFSTVDGRHVVNRRVVDGNPRWWTLPTEENAGTASFYAPRTDIDPLASPLRACLAEGVFSTLGARRRTGGRVVQAGGLGGLHGQAVRAGRGLAGEHGIPRSGVGDVPGRGRFQRRGAAAAEQERAAAGRGRNGAFRPQPQGRGFRRSRSRSRFRACAVFNHVIA